MLTRLITTSALTGALALTIGSQAFAQTELSWWHGMTGANNEMIIELTKEFNESQSDYKIVPVYKGSYPETLNAGIAAFRSKQPPAIIQVFDAGSGVMMAAEGAMVPAAEVLEKGGFKFDKSQYLPVLLLIIRSQTAPCCRSHTTRLRRSFIIIRTHSRRLVLTKTTHQRPGRKFLKQPRRSSRAALLLAALPRHGSHGFRLKILPHGTMFPMAPMKTVLAAPTSNSRLMSRSSLSTSGNCRSRQGWHLPLWRSYI